MRLVLTLAVLTAVGATVLVNVLELAAGKPKAESHWSRVEAEYNRAWYEQGKVKQPDEYYWLALQTNRTKEAQSVLRTVAPAGSTYDAAYADQLRKSAIASLCAGSPIDAVSSFDTLYRYDLNMRGSDKLALGRDLMNCGMATYLQAMTEVSDSTRRKALMTAEGIYSRAATLLNGASSLDLLTLAQNRQLVASARADRDAVQRYERQIESLQKTLPLQAPLISN